jgi:hypothetical protein
VNRVLALAIGTAIFGLALVGCGGSSDTPPSDSGPSPSGALGLIAPGPTLTVSDALKSDADGPQLVSGYLVIVGSEARLCESLTTDSPPQCGGASLRLKGLDFANTDGLQRAGDVAWLSKVTQYLGTIDGDTLTAGVNMLA